MKEPTNALEAWKQASILTRAKTLYQDGYTAVAFPDKEEVRIHNPDGEVYIVDTLFETCSCPFHKENDYCKHRLGYAQLLSEQATHEAVMCAEAEEAEYGRTVLESDRADRLIRETGFNSY